METVVHLDFTEDDTKALITVAGTGRGGTLLHDEARYPGEGVGWSVENDHGEVMASQESRNEAVRAFLLTHGLPTEAVRIKAHHEWKVGA